jgi:site-specific recombinase XerD
VSDNSDRAIGRHPSRPRPELELVVGGALIDSASFGAVLDGYLAHLERSPLSANTRRSYGREARRYLGWLAGRGDEALSDPFARDYAVRDYRHELKDRLAPASVNLALTGLDHFYRFLRLGPPRVRREPLPAVAPRALGDNELRAFLRAAERRGRPRDSAVVALMALAGLRLAEVAGLDVDDVAISARRGLVTIRHGKGDVGRSVPLGAEARALVETWLRARPVVASPALFLGPNGERLTTRSLARIVGRIGADAGLSLSAHVLRHTFVTRLVRSGSDVVLVAELAGHQSLSTTRRYALPSEADRAAAVEAAAIEY